MKVILSLLIIYFTFISCQNDTNMESLETSSKSAQSDLQLTTRITSVEARFDEVEVEEDTSVIIKVLENDIFKNKVNVIFASKSELGDTLINDDGTITYSPRANKTGKDIFMYTIASSDKRSSTSSVHITIKEINDPPILQDQEQTTFINLTIKILADAIDPDGESLTYKLLEGPTHGQIAGELPDIFYTPNYAFYGEDSIKYEAADAAGETASATIKISVLSSLQTAGSNNNQTDLTNNYGANLQALPDNATTTETNLIIDILANDTSLNDEEIFIIGTSQGSHGSVAINGDKTITYTPTVGYVGADSFVYTIANAKGERSSAIVNITVPAANLTLQTPDMTNIVNYPDPVTYQMTLKNIGGSEGDQIAISGLSSPWQIIDNTCESILGAGTSCTFKVTLTPDNVKIYSDIILFDYNNGNDAVQLSQEVRAEVTSTNIIVTPLYATNGINWNDYILNDDAEKDLYHQVGEVCTGSETAGYDACVHAGELRKVETSLGACDSDITAEDLLGVFNWTCDDSKATVSFYSSSFKDGKGLKDLINFTDQTFKNNSVSIKQNEVVLFESLAAKWWSNEVEELPFNGLLLSNAVTLSGAGKIYTLSENSISQGYNIIDDKVALVTAPDVTLTYGGRSFNNCSTSTGAIGTDARCLLSSGTRKHLWIEGNFSGDIVTPNNDAYYGLLLHGARFCKIYLSKFERFTNNGIYFKSSKYNSLIASNSYYNGSDGLELDTSESNLIKSSTFIDNVTYGIYLLDTSHYNEFRDLELFNSEDITARQDDGLRIYGDNNSFYNIVSQRHTNYGIYMNTEADNNAFTDIYLVRNSSYGLYMQYSDNNTFTNLQSFGNSNYGIYIQGTSVADPADSNIFTNVLTHTNSSGGIYLTSYADNSQFTNVKTYLNSGHGLYINSYSDNNKFEDVESYSNTSYGLYINAYCNYNEFRNLKVYLNSSYGINLNSYNQYNLFYNFYVASNGYHGIYISSGNNHYNRFIKGVIANNGNSTSYHGINLGSTSAYEQYNNFSRILIMNNAGHGVYTYYSRYNSFHMISLINNATSGLYQANYNYNNRYSQFLLYNNGSHGFYTSSSSYSNTNYLSQFASSYNSGYGLYLSASTYTVYDNMLIASSTGEGANTSGHCSSSCVPADGVYRVNAMSANTFSGKVESNDEVNTSDSSGLKDFASIIDWTNFENFYRGWGKHDEINASAVRGRCFGGNTCRIWDFRLLASENIVRNTSNNGYNQNNDFIANSECPYAVSGSRARYHYKLSTQTYHLINAFEIIDDGIGNDDGFCQDNEGCIYAPNFGAYQGEGDYAAGGTCTFNGGTISGVTMYAYPTNGAE